MITYTVKYRKLGFLKRWRKISEVKADGRMEDNLSRFFVLRDETRIEIPVSDVIFTFSAERADLINEMTKKPQIIPVGKN